MWTPDVYEGSPIPATAYLATIGKAAMFVVLLRFIRASDALSFDSMVTALTSGSRSVNAGRQSAGTAAR